MAISPTMKARKNMEIMTSMSVNPAAGPVGRRVCIVPTFLVRHPRVAAGPLLAVDPPGRPDEDPALVRAVSGRESDAQGLLLQRHVRGAAGVELERERRGRRGARVVLVPEHQ